MHIDVKIFLKHVVKVVTLCLCLVFDILNRCEYTLAPCSIYGAASPRGGEKLCVNMK